MTGTRSRLRKIGNVIKGWRCWRKRQRLQASGNVIGLTDCPTYPRVIRWIRAGLGIGITVCWPQGREIWAGRTSKAGHFQVLTAMNESAVEVGRK
jgi:hypothetical protein